MTERQLQIRIMKALRQRGMLAIHVPNEGHRTAREAAIGKKMGITPGVPDILVLDIGCAIEVKTDKGNTTKAQDLFLRALRACGWTVGVARSVEEALSLADQATNGQGGAEHGQTD